MEQSGYDKCFVLTNEQFASVSNHLNLILQKMSNDVITIVDAIQGLDVFEPYTSYLYPLLQNNYAAQTSYQNLYMTYGGTNWGNLAEPTVYTSYVTWPFTPALI